MANRKELPREKKLKLKIGELGDKIIALELNLEDANEEVKEVKSIRDSLNESVKKLNDRVFTQQRTLANFEIIIDRQKRLIDYLIDTKL